jgi:hypothetical protein
MGMTSWPVESEVEHFRWRKETTTMSRCGPGADLVGRGGRVWLTSNEVWVRTRAGVAAQLQARR